MSADPQSYEFTPEQVKEIISERDSWKAKAQEASTALKDTIALDKAYSHFSSIDKVKNPYQMAKMAVQQVPNLTEAEDVAEALNSWAEQIFSLVGTPEAPAAPEPPKEPAPVPPGMTPASPSPAAPGSVPPPEPLTFRSPEVQAAMARNDIAQIEGWIKEGRYVPTGDHSRVRATR